MRALDFNTRTQVTRSGGPNGEPGGRGRGAGHLVVPVVASLCGVRGAERKGGE